ncbi:hypothetical protein TSO221_08400 [Azospirillum sp. TSO22-1]|nr:hypothetical protein TSO221_08400 [Azospirillum sp. TSO22-1]
MTAPTTAPGRDRRLGRREGDGFTFLFDGAEIAAWPGETVAAALLAAGHRTWRRAEDGTPRGLFCGIGVCWECRCVVDGQPNTRACQTLVRPGMVVRRQEGLS